MSRRAIVAIIAVVAAALLIGGGIVLWLSTRAGGPDVVAAAYLDALSAGDGTRAAALLADGSDGDRLAVALEGAAGRISDTRVDSMQEDGPNATATVTFELGGEGRTAQVSLVRRDDRWVIGDDGVGTLTAAASLGAAVLVGEVAVDLGAVQSLLPAEYGVRAAPAGVLVGSAPVIVLPGQPSTVEVSAVLSPDATAVAQQQLDAYQDECTQPAASVPGNCGLRVPWAADLASLSSIAWRIEQRPVLALSPEGTTFAATGGIVVATATGTTPGGATASFTYRADDWALRGQVTFTADAMMLAVD